VCGCTNVPRSPHSILFNPRQCAEQRVCDGGTQSALDDHPEGHFESLLPQPVDKTSRDFIEMTLKSCLIVLLAGLTRLSSAFYDVGDATILTVTAAYTPPVPRHLSSTDYELFTNPQPSMITAVAPSMAIMCQGIQSLEYSIHFNDRGALYHQQAQGIFKRGVFATDPLISTCQSCDVYGRPITRPNTQITGTGGSSIPCSAIPYDVRIEIYLLIAVDVAN
jgi:hypothetical protein